MNTELIDTIRISYPIISFERTGFYRSDLGGETRYFYRDIEYGSRTTIVTDWKGRLLGSTEVGLCNLSIECSEKRDLLITLNKIIDNLSTVIDTGGFLVADAKISRLDLYRDFNVVAPLTGREVMLSTRDMARFPNRMKVMSYEGQSITARNKSIVYRIYDKQEESRERGIELEGRIRFEVQRRRQPLKRMGLDRVVDLEWQRLKTILVSDFQFVGLDGVGMKPDEMWDVISKTRYRENKKLALYGYGILNQRGIKVKLSDKTGREYEQIFKNLNMRFSKKKKIQFDIDEGEVREV